MIRKSTAFLVYVTFLLTAVLGVHMITSVSGVEEITEPVYVEIADYYDNRRAVVTVTADDWDASTVSYFEDMSTMLTGKHIYYTGAVITDWNPDWNQIQRWLDQGYLEVASHSRNHPRLPYDSYDSEIGGSKQDIIGNLTLPPVFSFNGTEYVYSWIEPYGDSDNNVRQKLGEYKYLTDRRVNIDDEWATWDSVNGLFDRIGFSIRMESSTKGGVDNATILNNKFDSVHNMGGIYHLMTHPRNVDWSPGQYADVHTSYISGRKDVWYVNFGLLYLYHWIDTQNIVQVMSTGSLQDKVFKINISSTDRQNYGAKYPVTYIFDIPSSWTSAYVNYRFRETDPWSTMQTKTPADFFNGINAVRFDFSKHKAYVSIGFSDASNEIYLQILPQNNQPVADFIASPTSGTEPLTVNFTDTSTSFDEIVSWLWDFGDEETSAEQNPIHTYATAGQYTVSLTVWEADGDNDTETKSPYIIVDDSVPTASFTYSPSNPLEGDPATFDASGSTGYDQPLSYSWDFGDDALGEGVSPTHTYAQDGEYIVTLTVTDNDGSTDSTSFTITAGDKDPIPNFNASPTSGTEPLQVNFEDTSTSYDGITGWTWNFGDGQSSTDRNPTHIYAADGTYTVSLKVVEGDGDTATETKLDYIIVSDTYPSANFSASPTSGSEPLTVSFADESTSYDGITAWEWDFNNDGIVDSTEPNPIHVYNQDGVYTVTLNVYENDGDSDTETKVDYVTVTDTEPTADFSATPTSGIEPLQVTFTDLSVSHDGIVSWAWDFGDGETNSEQNPTHTYTQEGTYTVTLTVYEEDGDSATETKADYITVGDVGPTADFTGSPTSGPEPLTVSFNDTSTSYDGVVSWFWDFGDGQTSTERDPSHTYASEGEYTVSLTVTEADENSDVETKTNYIVVADSTPIVSFTSSPLSPLEGDLITFDASSSTGYDEPLSYTWDFGDGTLLFNLTDPIVTHTYAQNGDYIATLTVVDGDGSTNSTSQTITVADKAPVADFSATPINGSEPLQVNFTDLSTSYDGITSWTWNFGDGKTSTERNPTHVYAANGVYTVTLTVLEADGSYDVETKMQYIIVTDTAPTADFSYLPNPEALTIDFTDQSTSYDELVSWTWDFGDGETSTERNPTHKFPDNGTFTVSLTVTDADGSTDTVNKEISVLNVAPIADFNIVSSPKPTIDEDITFIDQSSDPDGYIISWFWDLGDGTTSNSQNVTHRYITIGTFIVNLTVTDDDGGVDTISKSITIYDVVPPVTVHDYNGLWHTSDFTINLTATDDLSGVQFTYYRINDGPIMSVQADGQPFISVEGYNKLEYWSVDVAGNEEAHKIIEDIKLDKTNPTANAGPDQTVDEDTLMTFDGSASFDNVNITTYTWTFIDETPQTLSGMNPTYTFNTPGIYTVTLSVTDASLHSDTDTVTITVLDITKPIANAGDDRVVHEDTPVIFNGSSSTDNVGIVSYIWTFVDVTQKTLPGINATYIFETPGLYNITLTVTDAQGNQATDVITITVIDATWPAANAGPDQIVNEDILVIFDGSASFDNIGITSYIWTFTDGTLQTLFGVNPNYTFATPGVYTVTLNVSDAEGFYTTDTVTITVLDITPPIVDTGSYSSIAEKTPISFDASESSDNVGIVSYQWDFGDGTSNNSTISSVLHTYTEPGVYAVTLTVIDEAGNTNSTSISIVVYRDTDGDLIADHLDSDDDNDGMSDDWEIIHGLDPLDSSDASLDPDGDGLSNLTEFQIDSDPNTYTSPSPFPLFGVLVIAIIGFMILLGILFMKKL